MRTNEPGIGTGFIIPLIALIAMLVALDTILGPFLTKGCY